MKLLNIDVNQLLLKKIRVHTLPGTFILTELPVAVLCVVAITFFIFFLSVLSSSVSSFLFFGGGRETDFFGGGLVTFTMVGCADGICNRKTLYHSNCYQYQDKYKFNE